MKFIFVLFDSLNRLALQSYGGRPEDTPNFLRFSEKAITFDKHYVGSLPCMPARRDMHTGRLSMMHRSWGPLEPYDNSFAQILESEGTHCHLVSDHYHYFEDGGAGYHTKYNTYEFIRGQEYDPWKAMVQPPIERFKEKFGKTHYNFDVKPKVIHHAINLEYMQDEAELPGPGCFSSAFDFLKTNQGADNWFLQLELFDPHEPFHSPKKYRREGDSTYEGSVLNWPDYARVVESDAEIAEIRANYSALVRMCDDYFGRLLDYFDEHDMWKDTALLMTTDHGYLLSEHEWWGKCRMPYYDEISHIPMIFYHPTLADRAGTRCDALTQTPDLMPTFLESFGVEVPEQVKGISLFKLIEQEEVGQDRTIAFGIFGGPIGVTDGRYVMFHYPPDTKASGLFEYTLNPQHMTAPFTLKELRTAKLSNGFDFTKEVPLLKIEAQKDAIRIPMNDGLGFDDAEFALYDLKTDPRQTAKIENDDVKNRLYKELETILVDLDTPPEAYGWYALAAPKNSSSTPSESETEPVG